jgi:hypothetical protein
MRRNGAQWGLAACGGAAYKRPYERHVFDYHSNYIPGALIPETPGQGVEDIAPLSP